VCRSALTSGPTPWRACIHDLTQLHQYLEVKFIRLVVAVVLQGDAPSTTLEEFSSVLVRDLSLEGRQIQHLSAEPTMPQVWPAYCAPRATAAAARPSRCGCRAHAPRLLSHSPDEPHAPSCAVPCMPSCKVPCRWTS
jgi:hypothetical protein